MTSRGVDSVSRRRRGLAERRRVVGLSQEGLAHLLGVDRSTVMRWERGATVPQPWCRPYLAHALGMSVDEVAALLGGEGGDASGVREAAGGGRNRSEAAHVAGHVGGCDEAVEALAGQYRAVDPREVLAAAAGYADELLCWLDRQDGQRSSRVTSLVVDVHCLAGLCACHADEPAWAYRYLVTACDVAASGADRHVYARALGALSYLHSSAPRGGIGGDPHRSLQLLDRALVLAADADAFTRGWLATWRADQHATLGNLAAARADIAQAAAALDAGDERPERGFFARRHYGYGMRAHLDSVRGLADALAGHVDESARTFATVQRQAANGRRRVASFAHQALGYVRADEPEAACDTLVRSVDLAVADGYAMGLRRAAGVRRAFSPRWSGLGCVRAVDERLQAVGAGERR